MSGAAWQVFDRELQHRIRELARALWGNPDSLTTEEWRWGRPQRHSSVVRLSGLPQSARASSLIRCWSSRSNTCHAAPLIAHVQRRAYPQDLPPWRWQLHASEVGCSGATSQGSPGLLSIGPVFCSLSGGLRDVRSGHAITAHSPANGGTLAAPFGFCGFTLALEPGSGKPTPENRGA